MKYLKQLLARIPWQRRLTVGVWGNATEAVFSVSLVGVGLIVLVWCIVTQWLSGASSSGNELFQRVLGMVFSGAIVCVGGFRLVRVMYATSGSPEHRSRFLQQALDLDYLRTSEPMATSAPSVPQLPPGRLTAGQRLRFRVNQSTPSRGRLFGLVAFALLMLGVSTVLVAVIWEQWEVLPLDRLLMTASVLAVLVFVTFWLLWKTGRSLIEQFQLGLTRIELSGHPLTPGVEYQLYFQQTGEIRLEKLDLVLQCFEQTTYEQGTDICTHRETTFEQVLVETSGVQLSAEEPRHSLELRLPENAMHSFLSGNNQIGWQLVVKGKKKGCPEFKREFPILVFPKSVGRL
ncbi:MAG: hypothetical protein JNL67_05620 [Planctomycetaceae bacterium]|nr:hypothetical protein [Planctomycetaceae bacterium]